MYKKSWVHSRNLIQGFPTRSLLDQILEKGVLFRFKWKEMRNQTKQAKQIQFPLCSSVAFCKCSPEVRKPCYDNHFSLYTACTHVLYGQRLKGCPFQILSGSYGFHRAFQDCCPVLYRNPSKHLYQSSFSWEKTNRSTTRPTAYLLHWTL